MDYSSNTVNVLLENFNTELPLTRKLHAFYQSHRFIHVQMLAIGDKTSPKPIIRILNMRT